MEKFEEVGRAFAYLCELMDTLRGSNGCPWDREQTITSLTPYMIEEAYETLEAIESNDHHAHQEELGDLLLQIVFQSRIRKEQRLFSVLDVIHTLCEKLIRRHPHVFSNTQVESSAEVVQNWEQIKEQEKKKAMSRLAGIPRKMPALIQATRIGEKAASIGFDWPDTTGVCEKIEEEWQEFKNEYQHFDNHARTSEEIGDLLFAISNLSRKLKINPEIALRQACEKFRKRFEWMENESKAHQINLQDTSLAQLEAWWQQAKKAIEK